MYIVIELQLNGSTLSHLVTSHSTINEAYQKYYLILSAASVSEVGVHSAVIMTDHGEVIESHFFEH